MMNVTKGLSGEILLYCRAGFEKECAAEIVRFAESEGIYGYVRATEGCGFVLFCAYQAEAATHLQKNIRYSDLVFARQMIHCLGHAGQLSQGDRLTPIMAIVRAANLRFSEVFLETADTNEAKELSVLLRKFAIPVNRALEKEQLLGGAALPRLHLFFESSTSVYVGMTEVNNASPWLMGIPRLKFPSAAPSRSTLKLDEAFQFFIHDEDTDLRPGMTAVDLGAAPGGWTWQLVKRHIRTIAIDNGPMDAGLLESGIVEHLRVDGFRYRPVKPVDWLVCDMVEQPHRIAGLVGDWLAEGWCRQAIFNLKLPMKKRFEMVQACKEILATHLATSHRTYRMEFKQLYHDRAEITGYVCLGPKRPVPGKQAGQ